MSFAVEYRGEIADTHGCEWTVDISRDGYGGSVKELQMSGNPLSIEYLSPGEDLLLNPIKGSLADLGVVSDSHFKYAPLYAVSDFRYKVDIYSQVPGELVTGWVNSSFNTFVSDGTNITSAITTDTSYRYFRSNYIDFIPAGTEVNIYFNVTYNSGSLKVVGLYTAGNWDSYQNITPGVNDLTFIATTDLYNCHVFIEANEPVNCSISNVSVTFNKKLQWTGWVAPGTYSEPYDDTSYIVNIACGDGLGLLKNIPYKDGDAYYTGRKTESAILMDIFGKIYLDEFKEFVNIYETTMDSGDGDSPMDQVSIDTEVFRDFNCYQVLEELLRKYNAIIRQHEGIMTIYRPLELLGGDLKGRHFTSATVKSAVTMDHAQAFSRTTESTDLLAIDGGTLMMDPALKTIYVNFDYGSRESWISNHDLPADSFNESTGVFDNWTNDQSFSVYPVSSRVPGETNGMMVLFNGSPGTYTKQTFGVGAVASTEKFHFSFEYGAWNEAAGDYDSSRFVTMFIKQGSKWLNRKHPSENQYMPYGEFEWSSVKRAIYVQISATPGWTPWQTAEFTFVGLDSTNSLEIDIESSNSAIAHVCLKNINLYITAEDYGLTSTLNLIRTQRGRRTTITNIHQYKAIRTVSQEWEFQNDILGGEDLTVDYILGDIRSAGIDNVPQQFMGAMTIDGVRSNIWTRRGEGDNINLAIITGREIRDQFGRPRQFLSVPVFEKIEFPLFNVIGSITDPLNEIDSSERVFALVKAMFDVKNRMWDLSLEEITTQVIYYIEAIPSSVEFDYDDTDYNSVIVTTNRSVYYVDSKPAWVTVSVYDGVTEVTSTPASWVSGTEVRLTVSENTGSSSRGGSVVLSNGDETTSISVTQGKEPSPDPALNPVVTVEASLGQTFTFDTDYAFITIGSNILYFKISNLDGWSETLAAMGYQVTGSQSESGFQEDMVDGGSYELSITLENNAAASEVYTVQLTGPPL